MDDTYNATGPYGVWSRSILLWTGRLGPYLMSRIRIARLPCLRVMPPINSPAGYYHNYRRNIDMVESQIYPIQFILVLELYKV